MPRPRPSGPPAGPRVLVVDDDPLQLRLARLRFDEAGFRVTTAADAQSAIDSARRERPDVVVSDVMMPETDGFTLCRTLRADPGLARVPIVLASSAYVEEADRRLALMAGAHALVVRTADMSAAIRAVRESLGQAATALVVAPGEFPTEEYVRRVVPALTTTRA